jgi:enoyl-CoA hydratase
MGVTYEREGAVARITLDDGKVNAMNPAFFAALGAALDRAEEERPGAIVLTGRPGYFSAGLDLKLLPTLPREELRATLLTFGRTMLRVFLFPIPTVAAVSGHAVAGGAMLAFACDLRWMADGPFRIHLNEVAIGLPLPSWAIALAHAAIPLRFQTEALLHARAYSPVEACERAIVHGVVPAERLLAEALAAAQPLTALDQAAYATSKARHRAMEGKWVTDLLETEVHALPARPGIS